MEHSDSSILELGSENLPSRMPDIHVRPFESGDEIAFRELNEAWIGKYFTIEEPDRIILGNPVANILQVGGHIFMAVAGQIPVGCCALLPVRAGEFELAKMTVMENQRGQGIGRRLLEYAIAQARTFGATRLQLETNSRLANAIHLYESVGFQPLSPEQLAPSPYTRANVFMEMLL